MQPERSPARESRRQPPILPHLPPPVPSTISPRMYPPPGMPASGYRDRPPTSGSHQSSPSWTSDRPTSSRLFDSSRGERPTSRDLWGQSLPGIFPTPDARHDRPATTSSSRSRWSPGRPDTSSSDVPARLPPLSISDYPRPLSWDHIYDNNRYSDTRLAQSQLPPLPAESHQDPRNQPLHRFDYPQAYSPSASRSKPKEGQKSPSKEDTTQAGSGAPKKKKRRVALSCAECAKRKQKCNRETPCQHCVARRVPELCIPYSRSSPTPAAATTPTNPATSTPAPTIPPSKARSRVGQSPRSDRPTSGSKSGDTPTVLGASSRPPSTLPTLTVRVGRLEAVVNAMINRVPGLDNTTALNDWRINHPVAPYPPPEGADDENDSSDSNTDRSRSASLSLAPKAEPEGDGLPTDRLEKDVIGLDVATSERNPMPQTLSRPIGAVSLQLDEHGPPREQLQKLFRESGISPTSVTAMMRDLPDKDMATDLVDWYFNKINYVRYPISKNLFMQSFEALYTEKVVDPRSIMFLPLIFIVLAMAIRVAPKELVDEAEERQSRSLKMYWNSKNAVTISAAFVPENLQLVETRILTGLYLILMHERRLAEGWSEMRAALTTGQAIGLHRDGTRLGLTPYMTEYRRRLWSYLLHADATYSCLLGRSPSIDMACTDTLTPSNVELEDMRTNPGTATRPMTEPTFSTYLILRANLALIIAKMTRHFQKVHGQTSYQDVEALDADFRRFINNLPPAFKMTDPDKSSDKQKWFLVIHRYYIQTEVLHFIILLHRPWLLRKLRSNRYALSRNACFEAAVADYKLRSTFKEECPDFFETLLYGSFRAFNVAMIAGISVIIEPSAPYASDMRRIMETFIQSYPANPALDGFSQKEIAIIHTLHKRSQTLTRNKSGSADASDESLTELPVGSFRSTSTFARPSNSRRISNQSSARNMPRTPVSMAPLQSNEAESVSADDTEADPDTGERRGSGTPYGTARPIGTLDPNEEDHAQKLLDKWLSQIAAIGNPSASNSNPLVGIYPENIASSYFSPTVNWADESRLSELEMSSEMRRTAEVDEAETLSYWNTLIDGITEAGMPEGG